MRLPFILTAAALALSGCVVQNPNGHLQAPGPIVTAPGPDVLARNAARGAINQEMARRLPGANVAPYTECVISHATTAELTDIGRLVSGNGNPANAVAAIVARPATSECIARAATSARSVA